VNPPGDLVDTAHLPSSDSSELQPALWGCEFALVAWDADGVIRLANQAAADLAGVPLDEFVGTSLLDIVLPRDAVEAGVHGVVTGNFDGLRSQRRIVRRDGHDLPIWSWTRGIEVNGNLAAVSLWVPVSETGVLGRDPMRPWRDLVPIAIGIVDDAWTIRAVTTEITLIAEWSPADLLGSSLLDLLGDPTLPDPSGKPPSEPGTRTVIRLKRRDGSWATACLLWARSRRADHTLFALIGQLPAPPPGSARVAELERHLRRIGSEVRAAGILDTVSTVPSPRDFPQLGDLTTRQWEILSRLLDGERVPTIAAALFVSQSTIRNHLSTIFRKLGVHSQPELLELLRQPPEAPMERGSAETDGPRPEGRSV
jgi:DNA-binding CsgD family transcriptional regulator